MYVRVCVCVCVCVKESERERDKVGITVCELRLSKDFKWVCCEQIFVTFATLATIHEQVREGDACMDVMNT